MSARWSALVPRPVPVVRTLRRRNETVAREPGPGQCRHPPVAAPHPIGLLRAASLLRYGHLRPEPRNNSRVKLPVTELERVDFSRGPDRVKRFLGEWRYPAAVAREFRGRVRQSRRAILGGAVRRARRSGLGLYDLLLLWHRTPPIRHATAEPISGGLAHLADSSPRCSPRTLTARTGRVRRRVCSGAVQRVRDTALHSVTGTRGGPRES